MKLTVRPADAVSDRDAVMSVFNETRQEPAEPARFDWLYSRNPAGPASLWVLVDDERGQIVGAAASLPRWMWVEGKPELAHVLADFSILESYRSLGPAIKLHRATLAPLSDGSALFSYDFPSRSMAAVHRWMKVAPLGCLFRLVRPLSLAHIARGAPDRMQRLLDLWNTPFKALQKLYPLRLLGRDFDFETGPAVPEAFGTDFTDLDRRLAGQYRIRGGRAAPYLQWRYGRNPLRRFHLIKLFKKARLCGYAVVHIKTESSGVSRIQIYDLFCENGPGIRRNMLAAVLTHADHEGAAGVEATLLESNPWCDYLKRAGFFQRPDFSEVFVFTKHEPSGPIVPLSKDAWYFTLGDSDT
ncbi:MAG: hypothetical protein WHS46_10895 [Desulfosoma sp.]